MSGRLTYWKCPECHGTGRVFRKRLGTPRKSEPCFECDSTGNAFINGEAEQHKRRLADEAAGNL